MKKTIALIFVLIFIFSCLPMTASAMAGSQQQSVADPLVDTSYKWFTCVKCSTLGNVISTWSDGGVTWGTVKCPKCGYQWNTVISDRSVTASDVEHECR